MSLGLRIAAVFPLSGLHPCLGPSLAGACRDQLCLNTQQTKDGSEAERLSVLWICALARLVCSNAEPNSSLLSCNAQSSGCLLLAFWEVTGWVYISKFSEWMHRCKAPDSFYFFSRCDGGQKGRRKGLLCPWMWGEFSICGVTQVCRDAQTQSDRLARLQLQLSHRAESRETLLIPLCNPCLILPEESSKSTGSPANMSSHGGNSSGAFGWKEWHLCRLGRRSSTGDHRSDCKPLCPAPSWSWDRRVPSLDSKMGGHRLGIMHFLH